MLLVLVPFMKLLPPPLNVMPVPVVCITITSCPAFGLEGIVKLLLEQRNSVLFAEPLIVEASNANPCK